VNETNDDDDGGSAPDSLNLTKRPRPARRISAGRLGHWRLFARRIRACEQWSSNMDRRRTV